MFDRRIAIVIGCLICWVAALSTLIVDIPGDKTEFVIGCLAVAATIVWRTRPRANIRIIGELFYQQGVHDTLRRLGRGDTPTPPDESDAGIGRVIRLPGRRNRTALVGSTVVLVTVAALMAVVFAAWSTPGPVRAAAPRAQALQDDRESGGIVQTVLMQERACITSISPKTKGIKATGMRRSSGSGRGPAVVSLKVASTPRATAVRKHVGAIRVEASGAPRPGLLRSWVPVIKDR